jgi:hypothetical protein
MDIWLDVARGAAAVNAVILVGLCTVWLRNYRRHGARHTLGLLVFGGFLLVENGLWLYFYLVNEGYVSCFSETSPVTQAGLAMLCGLELLALLFLGWITWR